MYQFGDQPGQIYPPRQLILADALATRHQNNTVITALSGIANSLTSITWRLYQQGVGPRPDSVIPDYRAGCHKTIKEAKQLGILLSPEDQPVKWGPIASSTHTVLSR